MDFVGVATDHHLQQHPIFGHPKSLRLPLRCIDVPLGMPRGVLMLLAFVTGLTIDIFSNTGGLHAAACTLVAFVRPYWVKITIPRSNYDELQNIRIKDIEFGQFLTYTSVLVLTHHLFLYITESLEWSETLLILGKTITNGLITTAIVIAFRYFDFNQSKTS